MKNSHVFPFFWQQGDSDEVILDELRKIKETGIDSFCIESRTHPDFGKKAWFDDMRLILNECRKLGMTCYILDDKRFPTGYANGALEQHRELEKRAISEKHTDIMGPVNDCAVIVNDRLPKEAVLECVICCERVIDGDSQRMTGRTFDVTDSVSDGIAFFDLPEGLFRIMVFYSFPVHDNYIDTLREDSAHLLIDHVYEPHYEALKEYFGNTFLGFFSDEPFILREASLPIGEECKPGGWFPWNDNVRAGLESRFGKDYRTMLPSLYFPSENMARVRVAYMDIVTKLYDKCFGQQMGGWCRAHGVRYIGHIVEDEGYHCRFWISAGHYFRSLDGQDMAGVDIVSDAMLPGLADTCHAVGSSFGHNHGEFFHFGLAKLASSHAHIQPRKNGKAMCELFGNFGWGEGMPFMKWLADHMLVRGINHYVPHAFSPKFPDPDCPPHFYARGNYTEYRAFSSLLQYIERVSEFHDEGRHYSTCAILYHAEAEWSGGQYMPFERVAKYLTRGQLDFDILSEDYLASADVVNGKLRICLEEYPALVVPYTEIIDDAILADLSRIAGKGVKVLFVDGYPKSTVNGKCVGTDLFDCRMLADVVDTIRHDCGADVTASGENLSDLRYYHYEKQGVHTYFLTNEGTQGTVSARLKLSADRGHGYIEYDPLTGHVNPHPASPEIPVVIPPYGSLMLMFGDAEFSRAKDNPVDRYPVDAPDAWEVSFAEPLAYDPVDLPICGFTGTVTMKQLTNIARLDPHFSGFVRYHTRITLQAGDYHIDLGKVGEVAYLWVNGTPCGERFAPPYAFDFTAENGWNEITVVTTSHLGYRMRDKYSAFYNLGVIGMTGEIQLQRYVEND